MASLTLFCLAFDDRVWALDGRFSVMCLSMLLAGIALTACSTKLAWSISSSVICRSESSLLSENDWSSYLSSWSAAASYPAAGLKAYIIFSL